MTPARRAWYDLMIADEVRNSAYRKALAMYAPGRTVVDVGAGLGHLSLWALEAGASKVYMIEHDGDALEQAIHAVESAGYSFDRWIALPNFSHALACGDDLQADIVVAEVFDSSGVGEGAIETLKDARRFLRPGGIMIPDWMRLHICLIYESMHGMQPGKLQSTTISGVQHATWFDWCPGEEVGVLVQRSGHVHGFGLAFTLGLAPGVTLTNLPGHPATHWGQGALPFAVPIKATKGEVWIVRGEVDHARDRLSPDVSFNVVRIEGP